MLGTKGHKGKTKGGGKYHFMVIKKKKEYKKKMKSRKDLYHGARNEENFRGISMEQCPMHQIGPEK